LRRLVQAGEVDALVAERAWQEISRGLAEPRPSRLFDVLRDCGALARLAPALQAWCAADPVRCAALMRVLDASPAAPPALRFACLCHGLAGTADGAPPLLEPIHALCERWRVDADSRELALLVAREWPLMRRPGGFNALECLELLDRCDAWRRPQRLGVALVAFEALSSMHDADTSARVRQRCSQIGQALQAAQRVSVASLSPQARAAAADGPALGQALRQARLHAMAEVFARS
jgi:tRNA nucleotidyltransferase (CCA-adding enzyme)